MTLKIGQFQETAKTYQGYFNQAALADGQNRVNLFKQCETTYQLLKTQGAELTQTFASSSPKQQQLFSNVMKNLKELHRRQKDLSAYQFVETFAVYQGYLKQLEILETPDQLSLFDRCESTYQQLKAQDKELTEIYPKFFSIKQELKLLHTRQKALVQFLKTFAVYQDCLSQLKAPQTADRISLFERCEMTYQELKVQSKEITKLLQNFSAKEQHPFPNSLNHLEELHQEQEALQPAGSNLPHLVSKEKWGEVRDVLVAKVARIVMPKLAKYTSLELAFLLLLRNKDPKQHEEYVRDIRNLIATGHKSELALEMAVIENLAEFVQSLLKAGVAPTEEIVSLAFNGTDRESRTHHLLTQAGLIGKKDRFYKHYFTRTSEDIIKSLIQDSSKKTNNLVYHILRISPQERDIQLFRTSLLILAAKSGVQFTHENLNESSKNGRLDQVKIMVAYGVDPTDETLRQAIRSKSAPLVIFILNASQVTPTEEHVTLAIACGGGYREGLIKSTGAVIKALVRIGNIRTQICYEKGCRRRDIFENDVLAALNPNPSNAIDYTPLERTILLLMRKQGPKQREEYETDIRNLISEADVRSTLALKMAVLANLTECVQSLLKMGITPTEEMVSLAFLGHDSGSSTQGHAYLLLKEAGLIDENARLDDCINEETPDDLLKSLIQDSSKKPKNLVSCILLTPVIEIEMRTPFLKLAADSEVQFTHDDLNVAIKNHANLEQLELLISQGINPTDDNLQAAIQTRRVEVIKFILQTGVTPTEEHVKLAIKCGGEDGEWGSKKPGEGIIALIEAGAPRTQTNYDNACQRDIFREDVLAALNPNPVGPSQSV